MLTRSRSRHLVTIGLLALAAFAVRAVSLDAQSLWRDEVDALRFATLPWSEMLSNFTRPGWNGPLFYLLLRGWVALTGTSEYAMRFFSLVFGVLSLPLIYVLGRQLFNPRVGRIAALLVAASPYLVWYSQEVKMYTLVVALALLAIYSLHRALEGGGWPWWLAQIVGTTLAFYSHILAALLIPVQVLLCLLWAIQRPWPQARKRWRGALISLACLTLPYLPLVIWQAPLALQARETGFHHYGLNQMIAILLNGWSTGMTNRGVPWDPALMGLLAVGGLLTAISDLLTGPHPEATEPALSSSKEPATAIHNHVMLLIWLLLPVLSIWLISLRQPLFTDRYLIWSAPAFYLLVASALAWFAGARDASRWATVLLLGVVMVFNGLNLYEQAAKPIKSEFRPAAAYVASHGQPAGGESAFDDLIIFQIPYGRYTFDYYFPIDRYPWAEGLYTNHRTADGAYRMSAWQASVAMDEMTKGYDAIWLVATEVSMWDERNLVQQWLDEHAHRVSTANFARVDVYRYQLPDP